MSKVIKFGPIILGWFYIFLVCMSPLLTQWQFIAWKLWFSIFYIPLTLFEIFGNKSFFKFQEKIRELIVFFWVLGIFFSERISVILEKKGVGMPFFIDVLLILSICVMILYRLMKYKKGFRNIYLGCAVVSVFSLAFMWKYIL